ncbi:MAG: prenyltransferase [Cryobacterium sp.]|nr:prenyltransferase [Oligoflexia bacterium]
MKTLSTDKNDSPVFLKQGQAETLAALRTGFIKQDGKLTRVRVFDTLKRSEGPEEVIFRKVESSPAKDLVEHLKRGLTAIRAFSLTATAVPCAVVLIDGWRRGYPFQAFTAITVALAVVLLQIATNLYNDYSDYVKLIDLPGTSGGSGVFEKGWYRPNQILNSARFAFVAAVVFGIPTLISHPLEVIIIGGVGLAGTLLYSHETFGLKYHALGDLAVFILCGPALVAGYSYTVFGMFSPGLFPIGIFVGLLACGLLHANNLQDMHLDRKQGALTLANTLGYRKSIHLLGGIYLGAALALFYAVFTDRLPVAALLAALILIPATQITFRFKAALGPDCPSLMGVKVAAAKVHLIGGVLLGFSLFVAVWFG